MEAIERAVSTNKAAAIPQRLYPGQLGLLPRPKEEVPV